MKPTEVLISCPNCGKEVVKALHFPHYRGHSISRISSGKSIKYHTVSEKYEIISGCSECGKSKKELILIDKEGKIDHKERLKKWKEEGLPTRISG